MYVQPPLSIKPLSIKRKEGQRQCRNSRVDALVIHLGEVERIGGARVISLRKDIATAFM